MKRTDRRAKHARASIAADGVTRRDFLNGAPFAAGGAIAAGLLCGSSANAAANTPAQDACAQDACAQDAPAQDTPAQDAPAQDTPAQDAPAQDTPGYDPAALTGLRGNHVGSFEIAHQLRDGDFWSRARPVDGLDEVYDLVVVGGGISGLAAAHFYRARQKDARILIIDNHDDFGGHAKRNEFRLDGRLELMHGGTYEIDSPRPYSAVADGLLKALGIDPVALARKCTDRDFYPNLGLQRGIFLDAETFGADKLIVQKRSKPWSQLLAGTPLSPSAQRDIVRIEEATIDYLTGLSSAEKKARLSRMSYRDYLLNVVKADAGVIPFYQARTHGEWGVGIDAVAALDVWAFDFPGFQGLGLEPGSAPHMGYTAAGYADGGSYTFHFPDGNASIARLLVRDLIPASLPGNGAEDVVMARVDYSQLDRPQSPVRIRLSSVAVRVRNVGDPASSAGAEVAYFRGGEVYSVRTKACVLACYNMIIRFLCPDLPEQQKQALHYAVKIPLIYASVALKNWLPFRALGISRVYAPGCYFSSVSLNQVIDIGGYRSPRSPAEPMLVHMTRTPARPGLSERDQHRAGHYDILNTSFETFEEKIRDQLARILGPGGFDPKTDVTAITVNRWPHGYAYEYNPLFDPDWPEGAAPHEVGRKRFGRIAIANSDAGAAAYTDSAIDQAHRAVEELFGT